MGEKVYTRINHVREDGLDTVTITAGDGWITYTAKEPVNTEVGEVESAVHSLWEGYFHAIDHERQLGGFPLIIQSNVDGAIPAFIKEFEEPPKEADE
ncbi:hypothetical protein MKY59_25805 [Paenibacillus sp. FSL W8-0426]|uniref:hypothetical protein n=1 Tax=Paenibacillus sp. FSL W8-0426 TaxID=2921714 RepID=UPI0030D78D75